MLIRASKVIGLPVFTINDGKKIENIEDVIYDPIQNRIEALLIEKGGWFSDARVVLFSDLQGIGEDAALIKSVDYIKKLSDVEKRIETIAKNDTYLTNTKIITEQGLELGKVSDIYFDSGTGRVEEFEVSQGTFTNWKKGKKKFKIDSLVTIGKDATIVRIQKPEKTGEEKSPYFPALRSEYNNEEDNMSAFHQQTQKFLDDISGHENKKIEEQKSVPHTQNVEAQKDEKQKEYEKKPEEEKTELTTKKTEEPTKAKISEEAKVTKTTKSAQEIKEKTLERRKRDAVGLYLIKNILTPDDKLLAKEGDMVTYKLLDKADEAGVLDQVLNNVSPHISHISA